jgi:hypothetical protein
VNVGSSFGIPNICKDSDTGVNGACLPTIGGVNLKDKVPQLTQQLMQQHLGFNLTAGGSTGSRRTSVLRLRFDFDAASDDERDEVEAAFARAIMFDARHAQTLYYKHMDEDRRAVTVDADLFRSLSTSNRYLNWTALGMRVYDKTDSKFVGEIGLKTPTSNEVVSFDIRNVRKGWFQTKHGFDRLAYASVSEDGAAHANLILNLATSDTHLDNRNLFADNADAAILAVAGKDAVQSIDGFADAVQRDVRSCSPDDDKCALDKLGGGKDAFQATVEDAISKMPLDNLPPDFAEIAKEAARVRIANQAVSFKTDVMSGPAVDFTFGFRLDESGLDALMKPEMADKFKAAAYEYLAQINCIDRAQIAPVGSVSKDDLRKRFQGADVPSLDPILNPSYKDIVENLAKVFASSAKAYLDINSAEGAAQAAMKEYGKRYVPLFIGLDLKSVAAAEKAQGADKDALRAAAFTALTHQRAAAAAGMVDALYDKSNGLFTLPRTVHLWAEHLVGYTLVQMVDPSQKEVSFDFRVSGNASGRFDAAGLSRWTTPHPLVGGSVERVVLNPLDLQATARN